MISIAVIENITCFGGFVSQKVFTQVFCLLSDASHFFVVSVKILIRKNKITLVAYYY